MAAMEARITDNKVRAAHFNMAWSRDVTSLSSVVCPKRGLQTKTELVSIFHYSLPCNSGAVINKHLVFNKSENNKGRVKLIHNKIHSHVNNEKKHLITKHLKPLTLNSVNTKTVNTSAQF